MPDLICSRRRLLRRQTLRWMRVFGDTIFAVGTLALAWFIIGLKTGWSLKTES